MARSIIIFALLAALFAVFALGAQAVEIDPCPAFKYCAPKGDRFGFRRAVDKPGTGKRGGDLGVCAIVSSHHHHWREKAFDRMCSMFSDSAAC